MSQALASLAPVTDAFGQAVDKLTLSVSHFHQVYDLGVARGVFTEGGRAHYGRDITATTLPDLSTHAAVMEAANAIVKGEAVRKTAEGAAHVPMALPSAAEVAAVHADTVAKYTASEVAMVVERFAGLGICPFGRSGVALTLPAALRDAAARFPWRLDVAKRPGVRWLAFRLCQGGHLDALGCREASRSAVAGF